MQKSNQSNALRQWPMDRHNTTEKNNELLIKAIFNKDFSGNSSVLPRINFGVGGQESSPQSLTAHSLDRYMLAFPN